MIKGEVDYAIRKSLNLFDDWVDATGYVKKGSKYYYELQSLIEDSTRIGCKIASGGMENERV